MIDLRDLEDRPARNGYELQCPECGQWARALLIVDTGELLCRECWRAIEHGGPNECVDTSEKFGAAQRQAGA